MQVNNGKPKAYFAAITMAILFLPGCGTTSKADARVPENVPVARGQSPVRIAFLADKTGSTNWTRTPQPNLAQVRDLVNLLVRVGGEIGFGLIRDQSNRSLLRLRIEPPPEPVAKPAKTGKLFADARRMDQYRKDKAIFQQKLTIWQASTNQGIDRYKKEVEQLLSQRANARSTDIWGAVRRADLFLAESDASCGRPTRRWAVFVTDGLHNTRTAPTTMRSGARVVVVNGAGEIGCLAALHPMVFESIDAAVRHVQATEQRK